MCFFMRDLYQMMAQMYCSPDYTCNCVQSLIPAIECGVSEPASLCMLNTEQVRAVSRSPVMTPAAPSVGDLLAGVLNELAASPLRPARDISLALRLLATACIPPLPSTFFSSF